MNKRIASALLTSAILTGCVGEELPEHIETPLLQLGDFQVQVIDNQLRVNHFAEPEHFLWAGIESGKFLEANQTELDIKDSRSSYTIKERVAVSCDLAEIQTYEQTPEQIIFKGPIKDCEGVEFEMRFEIVEGQLQFTATTNDEAYNHIVLNYISDAEEHFYGFGEQFSYLDLKGRQVPVLTQEQGIGRGEPLLSLLVNLYSPGSGGTTLSSYYAVPQYITDQRRSIFLENSEYSRFDLTKSDQVSLNVFSNAMVGRIPYGEDLLGLIEEFTVYSGRMKALPDWMNEGAVLGLQGGTERVRDLWTQLRDAGTPVAGLWLQDWVGRRITLGGAGKQLWWNWELDQDLYPGWDELVAELESEDVRVLGYINPFLVDVTEKGNFDRNLYQEAFDLGYLVEQEGGTPYPITITDFDAGIVDISNLDAREWLKDIIKDNLIGSGLTGWMADFGEALPFEAHLANGETGLTYHNKYPVEWAKLNAEAVAEMGMEDDIVFFMRAGFTQSPKYSTLFWLGDQATTWDRYDGLKSAVIGLLNGGFSGLSLNHSDIGGYTSLTLYGIGLKRDEMLLNRWMEANAFSAVYRTHEGLAPDANAQAYSNESTIAHFAKFAKVYAALADYRKELMVEAEEKGYPIVRHPILHYPNDEYFKVMDVNLFQFMLGEEFMVAPALSPDTIAREVYLPEGDWVHLWTGETVSSPIGGNAFTADAPMGQPPVYYRAGSLVGDDVVDKLVAEGIIAQ
ncbi:MAG: alpha-glucosidase [Pseudomonadales bacterium]|nr:alpha-glucosidase [Pseudomonadales bacterium]